MIKVVTTCLDEFKHYEPKVDGGHLLFANTDKVIRVYFLGILVFTKGYSYSITRLPDFPNGKRVGY